MRSTDAGARAIADAALAYAASFVATNPPDPAAPTRLLFELQSRGLDLTAVPEPDLRGMATMLGLSELAEQAFLEDAASWLGRPAP